MTLNGQRVQGWIFKDYLVPVEAEPTDAGAPRWLEIAEREIGTKEAPGNADNPRVLEYHQTTSLGARDDAVAWCSAFVNWCMREAGVSRT